MNEVENIKIPKIIQDILEKTKNIGFQMVLDPLVGSLLNTLAMSKPSGQFLELGTGTGVSTAWILNGMDSQSTLLSVENNDELVAIAQDYLEKDSRVTFHVGDCGELIEQLSSSEERFDMIFADTWAGKYTHFEEALQCLRSGGLYVVDDMLPQSNWPEGHELKVSALITELEKRSDLSVTKISWASGVIIAAKK